MEKKNNAFASVLPAYAQAYVEGNTEVLKSLFTNGIRKL